ncbi:MAG: GIY-YIG nuclease family protein, partial [Actinomycetota bacterium]
MLGLLESGSDAGDRRLRHRSYQFTNLGKIPMGALPLALFNQVQEPLLLAELARLEREATTAQRANLSCLNERLADLRIYRAQFRRILLNSLYFLEVKADG